MLDCAITTFHCTSYLYTNCSLWCHGIAHQSRFSKACLQGEVSIRKGVVHMYMWLHAYICIYIYIYIQYFARNWPWYSLCGLHICIPLFSLYSIHMPLLPYMVIQPIIPGMALLWDAIDSSLSQERYCDVTMIWPLLFHGIRADVSETFYHEMQISWPDSGSPPIRLSDS